MAAVPRQLRLARRSDGPPGGGRKRLRLPGLVGIDAGRVHAAPPGFLAGL